MTDQFRKVAKKRERPSTRARDPESGKFENVGPINDPDLLEQCVRWVRAAEELTPLLAGLSKMQGDGEQERFTRLGAKFLGTFLFAFRGSLLEHLALDPEKLRRAKNPRLRTSREAMMVQAMKRGVK